MPALTKGLNSEERLPPETRKCSPPKKITGSESESLLFSDQSRAPLDRLIDVEHTEGLSSDGPASLGGAAVLVGADEGRASTSAYSNKVARKRFRIQLKR